jgi:ShK domain-like
MPDNLLISRQGSTRSVVRVTKTTSRPPPQQRRRPPKHFSSAVPILVAAAASLLIMLSNLSFVRAQECSSKNPNVCDAHERCGIWREEGECQLNKRYMREVCPASCESELVAGGASSSTKFKAAAAVQMNKKKKIVINKKRKEAEVPLPCEDQHERCHIWARVGECSENKSTMRKYCPKSCGFCAGDDGGGNGGAAVLLDDDSEDEDDDDDDDDESVHFDSDDDDDDDEDDLLEGDPPLGDPDCDDKDDLCTYWASVGECQVNRYDRALQEGRALRYWCPSHTSTFHCSFSAAPT